MINILINKRFNESDNLILNEKGKKMPFRRLQKINLKKIILHCLLIVFVTFLIITFLFYFKIIKVINKKFIKLQGGLRVYFLQKITIYFRKEVNLDNKIDNFDFENNMDFSKYKSKTKTIKVIAIYFPIFDNQSEIDEILNQNKLGWKNVKNAKPLYPHHYQPRIPIKSERYLGYYKLNNIEVIKKQIQLAKSHGIYGFGIYYYWISGIILFETSLNLFFNSKIYFRFFLIWKNDFLSIEKIKYSKEALKNDEEFIEDIEKYLIDSRYIRINEKPVIGVFNPMRIKHLENVIVNWRIKAREKGIGEIFILVNFNSYIFKDLQYCLNIFNGVYEFPPMNLFLKNLIKNKNFFYYLGLIYRGFNFTQFYNISDNFPFFRGIMLEWDNSSLSRIDFAIFNEYSTEKFYLLNKILIKWTINHYNESNQFLFINSWNNWNEGSYLEPDERYGFSNINSLSKALFNLPFKEPNYNLSNLLKINNIAVQAHIFYEDIIIEIINKTNNIPVKFDLYITINFLNISKITEEYVKNYSNANNYHIQLIENKGRDVLPFLTQLKKIIKNYKYICHIHSKKTINHPEYGNRWRRYLYENLLGNSRIISEILTDFENTERLGLIFPENFYDCINYAIKLEDYDRYFTNLVLNKLFPGYKIGDNLDFPAGNMFWARVEAIYQILEQSFDNLFPEEDNQISFTIMHGIERSWLYIVKLNGYLYKKIIKWI